MTLTNFVAVGKALQKKTAHQVALALADENIPVFPVHGERSATPKAPAIKNGFYGATTDRAQIDRWFKTTKNRGVGLVPSDADLLVVDIDVKGEADGRVSWRALTGDEHDRHTALLRTPSGGFHLWFAAPAGQPVRMNNGVVVGVDVRGAGGYVVAHTGERTYELMSWTGGWETAPESLIDLLHTTDETAHVKVDRGEAADWIKRVSRNVHGSTSDTESLTEELRQRFEGMEVGNRHDVAVRVVTGIVRDGRFGRVRLDKALDLARKIWLEAGTRDEHAHREQEWQAIEAWVLCVDRNAAVEACDGDIEFAAAGGGDVKPVTDKVYKPSLSPDKPGFAAALAHLGVSLRWNERQSKVEFSTDGNQTWHIYTEHYEGELMEEIAHACVKRGTEGKGKNKQPQPLWFPTSRWKSAFNATLHNSYVDPFLLWLEQLPAWDGKSRLDRWLSDVFESSSDPILLAYASKQPLIGAVQRALRPGTKIDEMVVLIGKQGLGKSTVWKFLLPEEQRTEWFSDSLVFSTPNKIRFEASAGAVFVEAAEMAGSTRAEIASVKAYLSRTHDTLRLPYHRHALAVPRRHITLGTANPVNVLPDDRTGNRRYVPITVTGRSSWNDSLDALASWMDGHRDQLWAEALHRNEEAIYLNTLELQASQEAAAEMHRNDDAVTEEALRAWLAEQDEGAWFTLGEAAAGVAARFPESTNLLTQPGVQARIRSALELVGCVFQGMMRRPEDGKHGRWWVLPGDLDLNPPAEPAVSEDGAIWEDV